MNRLVAISTIVILFIGIRQPCFAQDVPVIVLRNTMQSTVTILMLADQRRAAGQSPGKFVLAPGETTRVTLYKEGPFDVNVIPHDQANTVAAFRMDLRELADVANGAPVDLKGAFASVIDPNTGGVVRQRVAIGFFIRGTEYYEQQMQRRGGGR
jgi:hypothetical protein